MKRTYLFCIIISVFFIEISYGNFKPSSLKQIPAHNQTVQCDDLSGLRIDSDAKKVNCRSMPFLTMEPAKRTQTTRVITNKTETIPVGAKAKTLYLLGMTNNGWEFDTAIWQEHPELMHDRTDQVYIGSEIGQIEIKYADGKSDNIPIVMGINAWFSNELWANYSEPFASRADYAKIWAEHTKFLEDRSKDLKTGHERYFVAVKLQNKLVESIIIHDNLKLRGRPLISAITLTGAGPAANLEPFGKCTVSVDDLKPRINSAHPGNWRKDIDALSDLLYTNQKQLPKNVKVFDFPQGLVAARIKFSGGRDADMLSNLWVANVAQIALKKFNAQTGFFGESEPNGPAYGRYNGIGTWKLEGHYADKAFSRSTDHFATLILRCVNNDKRLSSFIDYCDKYLYFYRNNHDPNKGPDNTGFDSDHWPADAPPNWAFVLNVPGMRKGVNNELPGNQEMDGHGSTIVARWVAWRLAGMRHDDWLMAPRKDVYNKSRWDSSRDAAEFICWLMDYTGKDVMWSEGESTGWGVDRIPRGMDKETDPAKIKKNYANSDMYEPYPTFVCYTALRCSAQMADAVGDANLAQKWREYANRLHDGMIRLLATGDSTCRTWRISPNSLFPATMDSLVQAWFSLYFDGLDPKRLDPVMTPITRNSFKEKLAFPCGHKPTLGFGYGIGWLTQSALVLDEMDDAGKLLVNIAHYAYDKNMDYADSNNGIDWRQWLWLFPEGTNILPNGRWHRIGDLSNGANQGPPLHAIEACAGIDDANPADIRIMPRLPDPLTGISVENFQTLVPASDGLSKALVNYKFDRNTLSFSLRSDKPLPKLAIRLGPFGTENEAQKFVQTLGRKGVKCTRVDCSGTFKKTDAFWVWIENLSNIDSIHIDQKTVKIN